MKTLLKIIGAFFLVLLLLLGGGIYLLSTDRVQQWLYGKGVEMLQETLGTRVKVDKIAVSFSKGGVALYGLEVDDRQDVTMLTVDTLETMVDLTRIFERKVEIERIYLHGAKGVFYKERPDTAANYQFALDVIKELSKSSKTPKQPDDQTKQTPLALDLKLLSLQRTSFKWDVRSLPHKLYKFDGKKQLDTNHLSVVLDNVRISGHLGDDLPENITVKKLKAREEHSQTAVAFDMLDLALGSETSLKSEIENLSGTFQGWSFTIDDVNFSSIPFKEEGKKVKFDFSQPIEAEVKELNVRTGSTTVNVPKVPMKITFRQAPSQKVPGKMVMKPRLAFSPSSLSARVICRDFARYRVPPLQNFTTPLLVTANFDGELDNLNMRNIRITDESKKRLDLRAEGVMKDITVKKKFKFHFRKIHLKAHGGIKEQLVGHFAKTTNLKMQDQMRKLGDIDYDGYMNIYKTDQDFHGTVRSKFGNLRFDFNIHGTPGGIVDGRTRYLRTMQGTMSTKDFKFGEVMEVKEISTASFTAKYKFDITGKKTQKALRLNRGKLPIGNVEATITEANLLNNKLIIHKAYIGFDSDGSTASGTAMWIKKLFNIGMDFLYHQTDKEQYYTYKTYFTKHDKKDPREWTEEEKEKAKQKYAMRTEKLAAKEAKKAEKEARKAEKAARKAEKAARKAAEKEAAKNDTTKKKKKKFLFF
ncbi:MAG: hypothetical protein IKO28_02110 [Prevotella sp.]|nr:hypothetical protein [Prevotella sp.]